METGRNYLKSRLRSHPDVAKRWHADLLKEEIYGKNHAYPVDTPTGTKSR
jgi:hypothetical protein